MFVKSKEPVSDMIVRRMKVKHLDANPFFMKPKAGPLDDYLEGLSREGD